MSGQSSMQAHRLKVCSTILFHSTCAISVTLVSKSALNGIDAPVALLLTQTLVQVVLLTLVGIPAGWISIFRPLSTWRAFVPLALARVVGVLAKTFCLAAVDASFYQIARGLLLPFTLALSFIFLGKSFASFPTFAIVGCGSIIMGFAIGMFNDMAKMMTSSKGLFLGVGSSLTTAIESVVVKKFVGVKAKETGEGVIQMVWMSNVISIGLYLPILLISGEWSNPAVQTVFTPDATPTGTDWHELAIAHAKSLSASTFLHTCLLTGFFSFLLTLATFLQISITSPTTHMIITAARGVAQSAFAVLLLPHETMSRGRIISMICILGGSALYGWAEDRAMAATTAVGYDAIATDAEEGKLDNQVDDSEEK